MYVCMYGMHVCMYVMYVYTRIMYGVYVCIYVCLYACMRACMHACMQEGGSCVRVGGCDCPFGHAHSIGMQEHTYVYMCASKESVVDYFQTQIRAVNIVSSISRLRFMIHFGAEQVFLLVDLVCVYVRGNACLMYDRDSCSVTVAV